MPMRMVPLGSLIISIAIAYNIQWPDFTNMFITMTIHTKSSENKKPNNAKKPIFTRHYCEYLRSISDIAELIETVARNFFESTAQPTSCLRHLLPPPRDPELLSRLRAPSKYPCASSRTKKYQSFISFAISNYQTS